MPRLRGADDAVDACEHGNEQPGLLAPADSVRGEAKSEHLVSGYQPVLTGGDLRTCPIDGGLHLTSRADLAVLGRAPHSANFSTEVAPGAAVVEGQCPRSIHSCR